MVSVKYVDLARSVYTIQGTSLAFESMAMVYEYIEGRWPGALSSASSFSTAVSDFTNGVDLIVLTANGREFRILRRRVVDAQNLESVRAHGW